MLFIGQDVLKKYSSISWLPISCCWRFGFCLYTVVMYAPNEGLKYLYASLIIIIIIYLLLLFEHA